MSGVKSDRRVCEHEDGQMVEVGNGCSGSDKSAGVMWVFNESCSKWRWLKQVYRGMTGGE